LGISRWYGRGGEVAECRSGEVVNWWDLNRLCQFPRPLAFRLWRTLRARVDPAVAQVVRVGTVIRSGSLS